MSNDLAMLDSGLPEYLKTLQVDDTTKALMKIGIFVVVVTLNIVCGLRAIQHRQSRNIVAVQRLDRAAVHV